MIVGKEFTFEAAHSLPGHVKCGHVHGHTYHVEIEVEGLINECTGMVMDLHTLSDIGRQACNYFDHSLINATIPTPTCENICTFLVAIVRSQLPLDIQLKSLKVREGEGGYAIFKG